MTRSEDRWVYPADGADPRDHDDPDRLEADVADRQISHDQGAVGSQGISSDKPGIDISEREAVDHVRSGETYAEDPRAKQDPELTGE